MSEDYSILRSSMQNYIRAMAQDKFSRLDELAAPTGYVAPSTEEELVYLTYFRQVCKRYNIVFADADPDERNFVIRMAEKGYYPKRA